MRQHELERRRLTSSEGETRAVGDVDGDDAAGREKAGEFAVELDARDVSRNARTGEHIDDDHVDRTVQGGGQPSEQRASIPVSNPDARLPGQREVLAHEGDEVVVEFQHLLARPRSGRMDVAGQSERTTPEVQRCQGLTGVAPLVDDMADALHVLEEQAGRVVEVDVRLRGAVDNEGVAAVSPAIGLDDRHHAVREPHLHRTRHARQRATSVAAQSDAAPSRATCSTTARGLGCAVIAQEPELVKILTGHSTASAPSIEVCAPMSDQPPYGGRRSCPEYSGGVDSS